MLPVRASLNSPLRVYKTPITWLAAESWDRAIQNGLSLTDRSKQTGACQRAKAPETGHREGRSWVDFGRKPGVPSVRF